MTDESFPRWGEADSDPLADIAAWREQLNRATYSVSPDYLILSERTYNRIERMHARMMLTKRAYRRWRGRRRAERRLAARSIIS